MKTNISLHLNYLEPEVLTVGRWALQVGGAGSRELRGKPL